MFLDKITHYVRGVVKSVSSSVTRASCSGAERLCNNKNTRLREMKRGGGTVMNSCVIVKKSIQRRARSNNNHDKALINSPLKASGDPAKIEAAVSAGEEGREKGGGNNEIGAAPAKSSRLSSSD